MWEKFQNQKFLFQVCHLKFCFNGVCVIKKRFNFCFSFLTNYFIIDNNVSLNISVQKVTIEPWFTQNAISEPFFTYFRHQCETGGRNGVL
jgi:hypothetical protein